MSHDVDSLKLWLKRTYQVNVTYEWLRQIVDEIHSKFRNCIVSRIQDEVWKKWLSTDLHICPNACLPKDLQSKVKQAVNGNFILQVDEIRDISQPCYSQLMKITNQDEQDLVSDEKSKKPIKKEKTTRVLKLNLSDGVENVFGIEYKPISFLNNSITPGSKICVHGSFICRLGTFLLTQENARFLGGGVEALKEENTQDKVLARVLGNESLLRLSSNNAPNSENRIVNVNIDLNDGFDNDDIDLEEVDRLERIALRDATNSAPTRRNNQLNNQLYSNSSSNENDENDGFDDDFIDLDELDRLERLAVENDAKSTRAQSTNCFSADKRNTPASSIAKIIDLTNDLWNDGLEDDLNFDDFAATPQAKFLPPPNKKPCLQIPSLKRNIFKNTVQLPFTYLKNILNVPVSRRKKNYTGKGFFMTLTSALDHNCETKWTLKALINDGTASLDVILDNQVLEELIGFKANEIRNLSRRAKYDMEICRKLDNGFENCKTTITNFTGLIDIAFSELGEASVIKIRDLTEGDVRLIDLAVDDSILPAEFQK